MKDLEIQPHTSIEVSIKQKKEIKYQLIGQIIPHEGHTIWEIDESTMMVSKAEFSNATYKFGGDIKNEVLIKKGCKYVSALNIKNALKKYNQGKSGSKELNRELLKL